MRNPAVAVRQRELRLAIEPQALAALVRRDTPASLWLGGDAGAFAGWNDGSALAAVDPLPMGAPAREGADRVLGRVDRRLLERRSSGGTDATGLAVVLAYEALDRDPRHRGPRTRSLDPHVLVLEVDRSLRPLGEGRFLLTERVDAAASDAPSVADRIERLVDGPPPAEVPAARVVGEVRSSLGQEAYCRAVERIREHIREGDIYQANLCQVLRAEYRGDPWRFHRELSARAPAPRSAFLEARGIALASFSPEVFLRGRPPDRIETWPIKGTRAREADPTADARAAAALLGSEKDRAELLMIVDLERNDLGRVCRTGTVAVRELARLLRLSTLYHLVGCVEGRLRGDAGIAELLHATFPGGSISGAPKTRARQILAEIEPHERGWFTGSLLWFGDDGSLDSSILIRSVIFDGQRLRLGAGCGIVADSEPEQEWVECMHKARGPAEALGFAAEEAR